MCVCVCVCVYIYIFGVAEYSGVPYGTTQFPRAALCRKLNYLISEESQSTSALRFLPTAKRMRACCPVSIARARACACVRGRVCVFLRLIVAGDRRKTR